ncbi:MAG: hypothetical protein FWC50_10200 [Planctomycetaceae bacterium]|nr:hypothetical protein [Planctomycetaceae bacterium]
MAAGNGAQRSDRIIFAFGPVASLRYAPGCHSRNAVVIFIQFLDSEATPDCCDCSDYADFAEKSARVQ